MTPQQLTRLAFEQGRNLAYLERLVAYIESNPRFHSPVAVLTALIKANADRQPLVASPASTPARLTARPGSAWLPARPGPIDFSKFEPGGKYAYLVGNVSQLNS